MPRAQQECVRGSAAHNPSGARETEDHPSIEVIQSGTYSSSTTEAAAMQKGLGPVIEYFGPRGICPFIDP